LKAFVIIAILNFTVTINISIHLLILSGRTPVCMHNRYPTGQA